MTAPVSASSWRDHVRALACAALGLAIRLDALRAPPVMDDHAQRAMLRGTFPLHRAPWNLFGFVLPGEAPALRLDGLLPWWTDDGFAIAMFRPLSSLALAAEVSLGGHRLAHATSALLFVALIVVAGDVFRATLPRAAAWIATLLLALTPAATLPLLWVANQNSLLAVLLGLVALAAVVRDRAAIAGGALFCAALAGEYALPMLGYAIALTFTRPTARRHAVAVTAATLAPLLLGRALHYGAATSQYLDPLRAPATWLAAAPGRALALLGVALFGQSTGADHQGAVLPASALATVVGTTVLVAAFARAVRAWHPTARGPAVAWAVGAAVAVLPVLAAVPLPRLLLPAAPGVAALLGVLIAAPGARFTRSGMSTRAFAAASALAVPLVVLHGVLVPWRIRTDVQALVVGFVRTRDAIRGAVPAVRPTVRCDVLLGALDLDALHYPPMIWRESGGRPSRCWRVLTSTVHPMFVTSPAPRTLLLRSEGGALVEPLALLAYRSSPLTPGYAVSSPAMTITVVEAVAGLPTALRIDLSADFDAYAWWVLWNGRMPKLPLGQMRGGVRVPPPF